jgi:hypothetical protein
VDGSGQYEDGGTSPGKAGNGEGGGGSRVCGVLAVGAALVVTGAVQQCLRCQSKERGVRDGPNEEENGGTVELTEEVAAAVVLASKPGEEGISSGQLRTRHTEGEGGSVEGHTGALQGRRRCKGNTTKGGTGGLLRVGRYQGDGNGGEGKW